MNTDPDFSEATEDAAALWASRLDGSTLGAKEREELDAWLARDPRHRELLAKYCQFSADLEEQLPQVIALGLSSLEPEPATRRASRSNLYWLAGVAAAAAVATVALLPRINQRPREVTTAGAERQSLTLDDGTRVELNARTSVQIALGPTERHVTLRTGEAYFQVSKDKARPFFVDTPAGTVRVTGTMFDVKADTPATLEVGVVEGSVQVQPASSQPKTYTLRPGDELEASASGVTVTNLPQDLLEDALAWRTGEIVLHGVPLAEAVERFARYHDVSITVSKAAQQAGYTVGGRYSLDDLASFLAGLPTTFPALRVSPAGARAFRISLRSEP